MLFQSVVLSAKLLLCICILVYRIFKLFSGRYTFARYVDSEKVSRFVRWHIFLEIYMYVM